VQQLVALSMELMDLTDGFFSPFWRPRPYGVPGPDPTGLVKGWAAHQASDLLLAHGLPDHVVNAAGDLVVSGDPSPARPEHRWRVGISDPHRPRALAGVIEVDATASRWAVATSGVAEHGAHVHDPHTGRPAGALAAATVATRLEGSSTGAAADAFATALVASGRGARALLGKLAGHGVTGVLIEADGTLHDPDAVFLLGL
jgi:thiamine biosynthesis lipoprotein